MTQLISDEYKELNTALHKKNNLFGAKGFKKGAEIYEHFIKKYTVTSCLDYGCGKGTLGMFLSSNYGHTVHMYDPCYEQFNTHPVDMKFDGVICSDVLEHIEPEFLDNVLKDIFDLGSRVYYLAIGLCPSNKNLSDGRNAHLIIEDSKWWRERLERVGFEILDVLETEKDSTNPKLVFYRVVCKRRFPDGSSG